MLIDGKVPKETKKFELSWTYKVIYYQINKKLYF